MLNKRILAIMPVSGTWYACYENEGEKTRERLIGWALVKEREDGLGPNTPVIPSEDPYVIGLIAHDWTDFSDGVGGFTHYESSEGPG